MTCRRGFLALAVLFGVAANALAIPIIQVYIEGSTYDPQTETWILERATDPVNLWVIAQTPVHDVKLSAAYPADVTPLITLAGSTTGNYGGFTDPSVAARPVYIRTVTDGSSPKLGDGSDLPGHGIYGVGIAWQEFALGDFTLVDSPLADFITSLPGPDAQKMGQIDVYTLSAHGTPWLHFDVYDHIPAGNRAKYVFAPFSHDGETPIHDGETPIPEPATRVPAMIVLGVLTLLRRRRA